MTGTSNCTEVTPQCPVSATTYGYRPNLGGNCLFAAIFGLCTVYQLVAGIRSRQKLFAIALTVGCVMELIGYTGRIKMHKNPWDSGGFETQIICLILAPSFVAAGIYWSLKHIVMVLAPEKSLLRPDLYPWIFVGCDIGSILLQAAGGGVAGAAKSNNPKLLNAGNNIMIAGIAFQVATMAACGVLAAIFVVRLVREGRPEEVLAYVTVLIRCIYRLPEMAGGWGNPLMQNEKEFMILDGAMVAIAVITLTVLHPLYTCRFLRR
ncbi:putative RTA1 domain protein [Aspergillus violaceofuscus CBS 115571]|uniref:Putative RTA1 domain protein n=1 Tax=Aspergillus violaceofuscus (strain CBS 115571) TaxID=1450538 RepID=A0A2V5H0P1_ASPV1|nr:putative RTA1 domain protein [Aspergillus violaceofuscus CBS 115571]